MTVRLGIVMDPIKTINYKKDSSLAMLIAAQKRGWSLFYMEPEDIFQSQGQSMGIASPLTVFEDPNHWFSLEEPQRIPLSSLDVILMRKDPPFDNEYIYASYLLEQAHNQGTLVVNNPQSLRDCNEKFFATQFPECAPPTCISRRVDLLKEFAATYGDVIYKPLDGMGGSSIFRVQPNDPNLSVIIETLTLHGQRQIMAQQYIPAIKEGDKRILLIDGKPIPYALARVPAKGELRGNLAAGGSGVGQPLSERDLWIAEQVGPVLQEKGLMFVGLDVIGDFLTEINVTSPTCIRELDAIFQLDIANELMNCIEKKLQARSTS
ncbi:glutathione synthase [Zooshikella sp. RANM57]|uniref:glutathione synthase n=1 Tax=Zooshikella sp. RANM57 TaxID=3425863 RepID=UPI003D6E3264